LSGTNSRCLIGSVNRTALVVGAGIGGLSAAIALRQAGWNIRVFERAESPRELGFGLALAPNAMAALHELGVADVVSARAFMPRRGEFRRPDGTILKRIALPPHVVGGPLYIALRPALHGALLEAVTPEAITLNARAIGFDHRASGVTLRLADGSSVDGDLLVGADGIDSAVRRTLHPEESPPRPAGVIAVRGATHDAIDRLSALDAIAYLGRGIESMVLRASATGIYWFFSLARELVPAGVTNPSEILRSIAPSFDDTFRAITFAASDLRADEVADRDPLPSWGQGTVTLLGDAAHPMLPHTGQGAAQAIIDAVSLGQALKTATSIESALRSYETDRRPKTAAWVKKGRRTASLMRSTNPVLNVMREVVIRTIPVKPLTWFYLGKRQ
jgi:2-polyprenyl-6-methoxyphenol hydroxylase-like FAD-dependent oxidoreductase